MVQVGSVGHMLQGGEAREEDIQLGTLAQACSRDKGWEDVMGMYIDESGTGTYCKRDQSQVCSTGSAMFRSSFGGGEQVSLA